MKEYRGKFEIDSFMNLDFTQMAFPSTLVFDEMKTNSVYDEDDSQYVKKIEIDVVDANTVNVVISFQNTSIPSESFLTQLSNLSQDLEVYFPDGFTTICHIKCLDDTFFINYLSDFFLSDVNCIFYYNTNSPSNKVTKTLNFVKCEEVQYTRPITNRSVVLDLKENITDENFNYVFLTVLNRFYFLDDKQMIKDHSVLYLSEDVLMSWGDLIRQQTGFVERNENDYNLEKVDDFVNYNFKKRVINNTITPTNDVFDSVGTSVNSGFYTLHTVGKYGY